MSRINWTIAANAGVLAYLGDTARLARSVSAAKDRRECSPAEVADPYYTLGTHPDLVQRLWDELGKGLPEDCRWIVHGVPALVRPNSGVIFGFAGGTQTYALALPDEVRAPAVAAGARTKHSYPAYPELNVEASTIDLTTFGRGWVFGGWFKGEEDWCRAAYLAAGGHAA